MNFMKYTWLWFTISAILIIPGVIGLAKYHLRLGIDFTGGTLVELKFDDPSKATSENITAALTDQHLNHLAVQTTGEGTVLLRAESVDNTKLAAMTKEINDKVGKATIVEQDNVGPTVSQDLTKKAIWAVIVATLVIILYIAWAFRGVPKPTSSWRFGVTAVAALLHDLLFVIGAFALLGHFKGYEVDSLFITALLTVMGFSVHDTIVVFDRIRENLRTAGDRSFRETANISLAQTLGRSLGTSLTVIFVLLALFLLGGESIKQFVLALLLGVTIGTYSSIFNATPLLVAWQERATRRA